MSDVKVISELFILENFTSIPSPVGKNCIHLEIFGNLNYTVETGPSAPYDQYKHIGKFAVVR